MALATKPNQQADYVGFHLTIDESAEGSLDLIQCLNDLPETAYFERAAPGFYFIATSNEAKIDEVCADFPDCLMKKEAVER